MTIAANDRLSSHAGDGSTTAFAYDFPIAANTELVVTVVSSAGVETVQTLTTHYTVTIAGDGTGTITFVTAPASGETVYIEGVTPVTQPADYVEADTFPAASHEGSMDRLAKVGQENRRDIDRAAKVPLGESEVVLPSVTDRASKFATYDASGKPSVATLTDVGQTIALGSGWPAHLAEPLLSDEQFIVVDTLSELQNLVGAEPEDIVLVLGRTAAGDGYDGMFRWVSGDQSASVTVDTEQGVWVAPSTDATGSSGTWKRIYDGVAHPVEWFGAVGDGTTDDQPAFQAAVDFAGSNVNKKQGGIVKVGARNYAINDTVLLDTYGVIIEGPLSWGSLELDDDPEGDEIGTVIGTFTAGPMFHIQTSDCGIKDLSIHADATREAAAITTGTGNTNCGILVEPEDTSSASIKRALIVGNTIFDQPADGIYYCGNLIQVVDERNNVFQCGRHGIVMDAGHLNGRTNKSRPGEIDIKHPRIKDCGGQSLAIGHPSQGTDLPYRIDIEDFEGFRCGDDATTRYGAYGAFIFAEQVTVNSSAFAGTQIGTVNTANKLGLYLAGRDLTLDNNRYVDATDFVHIDEVSGSGVTTENVKILGGRSATTGSTPSHFAEVDPNAVNVRIEQLSGLSIPLVDATTSSGLVLVEDDVTKIYNRDFEVNTGGQTKSGPVRSFSPVTLADDECMTIDFGARAHGKVIISGNSSSRGYAEVWFRTTSAVLCNKLVESGVTVSVGTTALTTGTSDGVDTNLNVASVSDNKLYIKNRTGSTGVYTVTLISMDGDASWAPTDPVII